MAETWEAMTDRHNRERDALMVRLIEEGRNEALIASGNMPKNLKSISAINAAVAIRNGLKPGDLRKQNRARHISHPRFEVMAKAHKEGFSLGQIGMFYGGMDHTSVLHGINRHAELTGAAQ